MKRIKILDGFRCFAICMVILDHYTSTFTIMNTKDMFPHIAQSLYPYGDKYEAYFKNGYLGVELFFIISGFVIAMTLEKAASFGQFIAKRLLRLFPLLLICSIFTFLIPFLLDPGKKYLLFHRPPLFFFPSLTFSDLWMWNKIFHVDNKVNNIEYIDNAYWTLGTEMKFYICISIIYFSSKANFFRNWLCFTLGLICIYLIAASFHNSPAMFYFKNLLETTFFARYIIYFTLGTLFYWLYENRPVNNVDYMIILISILICTISYMPVIESLALVCFSGLFLLFIYKPGYISIFSSKPVLFIGTISYPLYLIHQNAGVLLLNFLSDNIAVKYPEIFIVPVIASMIFAAYLLHKWLEVPVGKLSKKLFKK